MTACTAFSCGKSKMEKNNPCECTDERCQLKEEKKNDEVIHECDWQHEKKKKIELQRNIY